MAFSDIALIFIQMIVYFWSFITWPFYFIYYGPWKRTRNFKRKRATQIDIKTDEVTYRAKPRLSHLRTILKNHEANIRTMDKGNNNNNFILFFQILWKSTCHILVTFPSHLKKLQSV